MTSQDSAFAGGLSIKKADTTRCCLFESQIRQTSLVFKSFSNKNGYYSTLTVLGSLSSLQKKINGINISR